MKYAYRDYNKSLAQDTFFKYKELSKKESIKFLFILTPLKKNRAF